jgi:DNA-binding response OmpR family regulator
MKKILVIEDDQILREEIVEILRYNNYEVYFADNGQTGVVFAITYLPDLILCDIMMPEMNGLEVLNHIKSEKSTMTIPFMFVTALGDREEIRAGLKSGADYYLTKPFTIKVLLSAVSECLEKSEKGTIL